MMKKFPSILFMDLIQRVSRIVAFSVATFVSISWLGASPAMARVCEVYDRAFARYAQEGSFDPIEIHKMSQEEFEEAIVDELRETWNQPSLSPDLMQLIALSEGKEISFEIPSNVVAARTGSTLLHAAVDPKAWWKIKNHPNVQLSLVCALIKAGAEVNKFSGDLGESPLMVMIYEGIGVLWKAHYERSGSLEVMRALIEGGADPNLLPENAGFWGAQPVLVKAAASGDHRHVRILLDAGADVNLSLGGVTAWDNVLAREELLDFYSRHSTVSYRTGLSLKEDFEIIKEEIRRKSPHRILELAWENVMKSVRNAQVRAEGRQRNETAQAELRAAVASGDADRVRAALSSEDLPEQSLSAMVEYAVAQPSPSSEVIAVFLEIQKEGYKLGSRLRPDFSTNDKELLINAIQRKNPAFVEAVLATRKYMDDSIETAGLITLMNASSEQDFGSRSVSPETVQIYRLVMGARSQKGDYGEPRSALDMIQTMRLPVVFEEILLGRE